jgi:hypothetical protein
MDRHKKMDVDDWQDSPLPMAAEKKAHRPFLSPTSIGILGTMLLHAMLIQELSPGGRFHTPKPPEIQQASTRSKATDVRESLVLLSLLPSANASQTIVRAAAISSLLDLRRMKIKSPIAADAQEIVDLETLALEENQPSTPAASGADAAEQSRLLGVYAGQIQARIDRVWRRPRTAVNEEMPYADADESFQCEAQIVQDVRGNVQEVMLPRCNGSAAWRHSLVAAIQNASPLPAPPSEKVFRVSISLEFVGLNYFAGAPEEEYESERPTLVRAQ